MHEVWSGYGLEMHLGFTDECEKCLRAKKEEKPSRGWYVVEFFCIATPFVFGIAVGVMLVGG